MLKQVQHDGSITAKIGLNTYNRNDVSHNCRSFTYCGITTAMEGRTIVYKPDRTESRNEA
jgi:hypothetical protein